MQEAYNIRKIGVGVITFISLATVGSNVTGNVTSGMYNPYTYEAACLINDNQGEVCMSSELSKRTVGDLILNESDFYDFSASRKVATVRLHITETIKHVSNFEFEEEYEEI